VKAKILGVVLNSIDMQSPEYKEYRSSYMSYYTTYKTGTREGRGRNENAID
jgi:hypothetical protein